MADSKQLPSKERLQSLLAYDPSNGELTWKYRSASEFSRQAVANVWNGKYAGKTAGTKRPRMLGSGIIISIDDIKFVASRVIWVLMTGEDPGDREVDHVDRNDYNNAWSNLRLSTRCENGINRGVQANCKSRLKGVFALRQRGYRHSPWGARIRHECKDVWLGAHKTKGLAALAYAKASLRLHGRFSIYASKWTAK